jgi:putative endoribonuclease L-PSP
MFKYKLMLQKIYTQQAPESIGPYSQAILCGNMLYTSGQIPIDPVTGNVDATDIKGQTIQVMQNLSAILQAAGMSFGHVIKTTCFLKNMEDFTAFNTIYSEYFTNHPARSCIAVRQLPKDVLVEIELIACKD